MKVLIGIFAVGCLGLWLADYSYPPVQQTRFVLGMLFVWFVGVSILGWAQKNDDDETSDSYYPKKRYLVIAFIPWLACAMVVANALLDSSTESAHTTAVTTRSTGRSGSSVSVASWNTGGKTIRIPVNGGCYDRLPPGKSITVIEKDGALGMHWIAGIAECSR